MVKNLKSRHFDAYYCDTKEEALAQALDSEMIAGAALDVFVSEPLPADSPLLRIRNMERLRLAPHVAWASVEARERLVGMIAGNISCLVG